jgi:hypothetical protein
MHTNLFFGFTSYSNKVIVKYIVNRERIKIEKGGGFATTEADFHHELDASDAVVYFYLGSNNKKKIELIELYLASALAS